MDGPSQEAPTCPPSPVLRDEVPFDEPDDGNEVSDEEEDDRDDYEDWDAWAPTGKFNFQCKISPSYNFY